MFETLGLKSPGVVLFLYLNTPGFCCNFAYTGNRYAVDLLWQTRNILRGDSEEQFEIFPAVQRQRQRIESAAAAKVPHVFIEGNRSRINHSADVTFFAEMIEVGR